MNDKIKAIVDGLTDRRRAALKARDDMLERIHVEVLGVDITTHPRLSPELAKDPRRPGPPGQGATRRGRKG